MSCLLEWSSNSLIAVIELVVMLLGYKPRNLLTRAARIHQGRCWAWVFCLEVLLQPAEGQQSHVAYVLFQGFAVVASLSSSILGNNVKQSPCGRLNDQRYARCVMAIAAGVFTITCHMQKLAL